MLKSLVSFRSAFIVSLIAVGVGSAFAQNMSIYGDSLENGYQNWSWCASDLADKSQHHTGAASAKITYTAAWQGFYVHGQTFPLNTFSGLTFYITGGATAGRSLNIYASINGNSVKSVDLNKYIEGRKVPARTWAKVSIPLAALGLKPTDRPDGIVIQDSKGSTQPAFWVDDIAWLPAAAPNGVVVSIDTANVVRSVDLRHFGINTAVWNANLDTAKTKARVADAGYKMFRFPGGSLSDSYHWKTNKTDGNDWQWGINFDNFANVTKTVGGQAYITINYGSGTVTEATEWVTYSKTKKYGYKYLEIGNENFGTWENDTHARKNDPYTYAQEFAKYFKAMKLADRTIKIGAVAAPGEDAYVNFTDHPVTNPRTKAVHNGWTCVMLANLAKLGVTPDYLIYHRYPYYIGNECDYILLQSGTTWKGDIADIRQQLADYMPTTGRRVEIICNENNGGGTGKQMVSLVDGLYLADSFGNVLQTECNGYAFWDLYNGQDTSGNMGSWLYGWRMYGDWGQLDPNGDPYPSYYVQKLISKFAATGDKVVSCKSDSILVASFAILKADGSVTVLLVNKHPSAAIPVQTSIQGVVNKSKITVYGYGIAQDEAARTGVGSPDIFTQSLTNLADTYAYSLAPYSVAVLTYKKN
jgi:hypothetical protein